LRGDHPQHTVHIGRRGGVHAAQLAVGQRGADHAQPQFPEPVHVVAEGAHPAQQPGILLARHVAADRGHGDLLDRPTSQTAATIPWYPVHRHRFAAIASRTASSSGSPISAR
jgi:hypothetical protein